MAGHILFYSDKCPYCHKLLVEIEKKNLMSGLKFVCVDTVRAPPMITQVPTLIVPQCTKPLVGKEAFAWVSNQGYFNIPTNNIQLSGLNARPKVDASLSYSKLGVSSKFTSLNDEADEPACLANTVQTGYDFGVLKGYKDTYNDNGYNGVKNVRV